MVAQAETEDRLTTCLEKYADVRPCQLEGGSIHQLLTRYTTVIKTNCHPGFGWDAYPGFPRPQRLIWIGSFSAGPHAMALGMVWAGRSREIFEKLSSKAQVLWRSWLPLLSLTLTFPGTDLSQREMEAVGSVDWLPTEVKWFLFS